MSINSYLGTLLIFAAIYAFFSPALADADLFVKLATVAVFAVPGLLLSANAYRASLKGKPALKGKPVRGSE